MDDDDPDQQLRVEAALEPHLHPRTGGGQHPRARHRAGPIRRQRLLAIRGYPAESAFTAAAAAAVSLAAAESARD